MAKRSYKAPRRVIEDFDDDMEDFDRMEGQQRRAAESDKLFGRRRRVAMRLATLVLPPGEKYLVLQDVPPRTASAIMESISDAPQTAARFDAILREHCEQAQAALALGEFSPHDPNTFIPLPSGYPRPAWDKVKHFIISRYQFEQFAESLGVEVIMPVISLAPQKVDGMLNENEATILQNVNVKLPVNDKSSDRKNYLEATSGEKELGTRERKTLLTIIAALAEVASYKLDNPHKLASNLAGVTERLGHRVSKEAIAIHLIAAHKFIVDQKK